MAMAWLLVSVAGLFETGFAVSLDLPDGFTRLWPTIGFCVFALTSFGLPTLSLKKLDVGPAYAVWTGIGASGTAIYGMAILGDLVSALKIASITLVIVGTVGLQLSGSASEPEAHAPQPMPPVRCGCHRDRGGELLSRSAMEQRTQACHLSSPACARPRSRTGSWVSYGR